MKRTANIKGLFNGPGLIRIVGAHDGLGAKLVERSGFDGVWASGLEISTSYAVPDASILTMSQYLERACEMSDAVSIPVVADCDTGYGNSNNVIHMVKKYEAAGISAICIEDKRFPKVNSLLEEGRQELAPIAEFVGKIMAAKNAQSSTEFMVVARVEALIAGWGEKEALLRAEKYVEAGADAVMIHSKAETYDEIVSFAKKWGKRSPLVIVPTTYPSIMADFSEKELLSMGIKMVVFANQGLRSAIKAMNDTFAEIKRVNGIHTLDGKIVSLEEIFHLQGMTDFKRQEKEYLKSENEDVSVIMPAAGGPVHQDSIIPLLADRPLCMIDINGKTLLERNLNTLKELRIKNVNMVVGYKKESILKGLDLDGVNLITNNDFKVKHLLHSIMLAEQEMEDRTLIVYADILFDKNLIGRILNLKEDIVLVGDNTYKKFGKRNKKLELIKTSETLTTGKREIANNELFTVKKIGKEMDEIPANFEFAGITYLSRKGTQSLKKLYYEKKKELEGKSKSFHEARNFDQASFTDIIQEAIDRGIPVKVLPVNSGWMEIHEFEDYRFACEKIK